MKISAILKGAVDQTGRQPVQLRISNGKHRSFQPLKIKIDPRFWDQSTGRVKKTFASHADLNNKIRRAILDAEESYGQPAPDFPDADFFQYCLNCMNQWDQTKKPETLRQLKYERLKVLAFTDSLQLSDISADWLRLYASYCRSRGNVENTVWKSFKFLRLILNKAAADKIIASSPFKEGYPMPKYTNPQRAFLTADEVHLVESLLTKPGAPEPIRYAAAWFLIGCATGLRFGDLHAFNADTHIRGERLIISTQKTSSLVSMPLDAHLHHLFALVNFQPLRYTLYSYNRLLKAIGKLLPAIQVSLSSHVARHTFATLAASAGLSKESTGKMLGHTDLKTTGIYYQISDARMDQELAKLRAYSTNKKNPN